MSYSSTFRKSEGSLFTYMGYIRSVNSVYTRYSPDNVRTQDDADVPLVRERGFAEWDISHAGRIPIGATITRVGLFYSGLNHDVGAYIYKIDSDKEPLNTSTLELYNHIGTSTLLASDPAFPIDGWNKTIDLNAAGIAAFQEANDAGQEWFALGFKTTPGETSTTWDEIIGAPQPIYLYVFYTPAPGSSNLSATFTVRLNASTNLKSEFIVGGRNVKGEIIIRHSTVDSFPYFFSFPLSYASPETSITPNLKGQFIVVRSLNLHAELIVANADSQNLLSLATIRHTEANPPDLLAEFDLTRSAALHGEMLVVNSSDANLLNIITLRHTEANPPELFSQFTVQHFADLLNEFIVRQASSTSLHVELIVRHSTSIELLNLLIIRNVGSLNLFSKLVVMHPGSITLLGEMIIRHSASLSIHSTGVIRHTSSTNLHVEFIVQVWAALKGITIIKHTAPPLQIRSQFWIRQPWPLWTDKANLAGVISNSAINVTDAILETIIEGVMEDIQGRLDSQGISYASWTNLDTTPDDIIRATSFGVAGALNSRKTQSFRRRVIRREGPINVNVTGDGERALKYWNSRMMRTINNYLASQGLPTLSHTAEDEEPLFTMADIRPGDTTVPEEEE